MLCFYYVQANNDDDPFTDVFISTLHERTVRIIEARFKVFENDIPVSNNLFLLKKLKYSITCLEIY